MQAVVEATLWASDAETTGIKGEALAGAVTALRCDAILLWSVQGYRGGIWHQQLVVRRHWEQHCFARWLSAGMSDRLCIPQRHPGSSHAGAWLLTGIALLQAAGGMTEAAMLLVALEAQLLSMRSLPNDELQPGKRFNFFAAAVSKARSCCIWTLDYR